MKHMVLPAVFVAACLASCSGVEYYRADSYISRYDDLTKIILSENNRIRYCIDVASDFADQGCYRPGDKKYEALCRKYGDTGYNRKIAYLADRNVTYNASDLLSVKVYSDTDFDAEHPSGHSLADIVRFMSCSPKDYISSGYRDMYNYDSASLSECYVMSWAYCYYWGKDGYECSPIDKMLCDIVPEDLVLLGPGLRSQPKDAAGRFFSLAFEKVPDGELVHSVTVEVTTEQGRVMTGRIEMKFDRPSL